MNKTTTYRSVNLEVFQEVESQAWFYVFGFNWVNYRSGSGYPTYRDAKEAGEEHIDQVFKEHAVEI